MTNLLSRRPVLVGLGALVVLLAAALLLLRGGGSRGFEDVSDLVSALKAEGIECGEPQVSDLAQAETIGGQFGSCQIDGDTVNIHVYFEDPDRVPEHIRNNVSVRGQSPTYFTSLVAGSNWVVDTYSEATTRKIQEAIGGTIH